MYTMATKSPNRKSMSRFSFFSSVAADLALRLGPDSERSGRKVCKKYETLWLHKRGKPWKNQQKRKKHGNRDDTQISRPDLRFASRENSEKTQNGAGAKSMSRFSAIDEVGHHTVEVKYLSQCSVHIQLSQIMMDTMLYKTKRGQNTSISTIKKKE